MKNHIEQQTMFVLPKMHFMFMVNIPNAKINFWKLDFWNKLLIELVGIVNYVIITLPTLGI